MDTQALKTFTTLAEYKNFTKTADALFVAQSTVTSRVAELEREIGKQLFERNKRRVVLTAEGETFLNYARRILELSDAGIRDINSLNRYSETMRIGTTNTIYECYLFPRIKEYRKAHPQEAVKITIGHSNDLLQAVQDRLMDVAYTYLPFYKAGYTCEVFAQDQLLLVTSSGNDQYREGITQAELVNADYFYCNFALQEVGLFIRELFPPHYQFGFEIDNSTKLIPYLLEFGGVSFLPESLAAPYLERKEIKMIRLLDFASPKINNYKVFRTENEKAKLI